MSGRLHSAITVWMFLTFMTNHLFQSPFADTEQYWHTSWLVTVTFLRTGNKHVPLVLVCKVLKNPVRCGSTLTPSSRIPKKFLVGLKRTWDQKLSSSLMLLTFMTTHLFQIRFADTEQCWHPGRLVT